MIFFSPPMTACFDSTVDGGLRRFGFRISRSGVHWLGIRRVRDQPVDAVQTIRLGNCLQSVVHNRCGADHTRFAPGDVLGGLFVVAR